MIVYQIMEYRNWDEHYSWGIYSSIENAEKFLKLKGWFGCEDFEIVEYLVDEKINREEKVNE